MSDVYGIRPTSDARDAALRTILRAWTDRGPYEILRIVAGYTPLDQLEACAQRAQQDINETIDRLVSENIRNAVDNGFSDRVHGMSNLELAGDMVDCGAIDPDEWSLAETIDAIARVRGTQTQTQKET